MNIKQQCTPLSHAFLTCVALFATPTLACHSQTPDSTPAIGDTRVKKNTRLLGAAVRTFSRETGLTVVADTVLAKALIPNPKPVTDAVSLESRLDEIVKSLPKGTRWTKINLPQPSKEATYQGDDLADYVMIQERLFKSIPKGVSDNTLDVLGWRIVDDKALITTGTLNLRPVYLLFNPNRSSEKEDLSELGLTEEQQQEKTKRLSNALARMNPQDRARTLRQMLLQPNQIFQALLPMMTPEQRGGLVRDMGGWASENQAGLELTTPAPN
ncbi:MAG: hypothetical protein H7Y38_07415 [Armatimonadetes bacterium]|nr:hypothetical protein [Armatimonadota bacterium]